MTRPLVSSDGQERRSPWAVLAPLGRVLSFGTFALLLLNGFMGCWCGQPHSGEAWFASVLQAPQFLVDLWQWALSQQAALNRSMVASARAIRHAEPWSATLSLTGIAFAYGVLHAAGPGHGKAVISTWVLANGETVRRGIAIAFLAAVLQALSAIVLVGALLLAMGQAGRAALKMEASLEALSWILIALVGVAMLWSQARPHLAIPDRLAVPIAPLRQQWRQVLTRFGLAAHEANCACGEAHMPSPHKLRADWSWREAMPIALSVGIRPCTGAILLLAFTNGMGLLWAGILGAVAMAIGTALTVSSLAAMAVFSRDLAIRVWGGGLGAGTGSGRARAIFRILAALALVAIGIAGWLGTATGPKGPAFMAPVGLGK